MEDSEAVKSILSQYRASLAMLRQAIEQCPEDLWLASNYRNRYWHIAYHALFYTHLYVCASEAEFTPWGKHQPACRRLGESTEKEPLPDPYSQADLLDYHRICCEQVEDKVPKLLLDGPSGFDWLPFNRLELHFYNIGHIQHHTGQLAERLRTVCDKGVAWVRNG
jgi:hypothetical protein